jgi:hypothetical protein
MLSSRSPDLPGRLAAPLLVMGPDLRDAARSHGVQTGAGGRAGAHAGRSTGLAAPTARFTGVSAIGGVRSRLWSGSRRRLRALAVSRQPSHPGNHFAVTSPLRNHNRVRVRP